MDSIIADLLVGLTVDISRSDGRVHSANVTSVDRAKCTVMVEWYEKKISRGKEVELDELQSLNKELFEQITSSKPSPVIPKEKKYEGRLRSSRIPGIPAPSNPVAIPIPAAPPKTETVPRSRQTCLFRPPALVSVPAQAEPLSPEYPITVLSALAVVSVPSAVKHHRPTSTLPQMSEANKGGVATNSSSPRTACELRRGGSVRRKSVLPQNLEQKSKRVSCAVKSTDLQHKKGKFGDIHVNQPRTKQFHQMIEEYRETMSKVPLCPSDAVEAHKICVCVRKRPLNNKELRRKETDVISIPGNGALLVHEPKTKVDLTKYLDNQLFHFDYSFDETSTNDLVYRFTAKPLVQAVFEGGMATCFAYGQTGSGKTHTMGGDFSGKTQISSNGIYALAAQDVFTLLNHWRYAGLGLDPYVAFFEIYNGKVFDLLNKKTKLRVLEDEKQQVQVVGLQEMYVSCPEDVIKAVDLGSACRTSGQTSANANSSRSHAILQVVLRQRNKLYGKFSLVDLAGNERGTDVSTNDRATMVETAEINRSLLALKECIRSLGQNSDHIPFRMSKLTQVLRDSFIGVNSRTCMIAMVSPGISSCDYTLNTLRYADRVKELNEASKANTAESKENGGFAVEEMATSSSSEEDSIVPSVYEAVSQVAELEERFHEQLSRGAREFLKPMEKATYDVRENITELMLYVRNLLDSALALEAAVDGERMAITSPKEH